MSEPTSARLTDERIAEIIAFEQACPMAGATVDCERLAMATELGNLRAMRKRLEALATQFESQPDEWPALSRRDVAAVIRHRMEPK